VYAHSVFSVFDMIDLGLFKTAKIRVCLINQDQALLTGFRWDVTGDFKKTNVVD